MIIVIPEHLSDTEIIWNNISMVKSTGVRGSTLARLAMVLVLLSIGNTPALWQRAVNRQPGSRSDNS